MWLIIPIIPIVIIIILLLIQYIIGYISLRKNPILLGANFIKQQLKKNGIIHNIPTEALSEIASDVYRLSKFVSTINKLELATVYVENLDLKTQCIMHILIYKKPTMDFEVDTFNILKKYGAI